jgi:hypothetical protein
VAFRHGGALVVGETGPYGPARILNYRARERRSAERTSPRRAGGGHADL